MAKDKKDEKPLVDSGDDAITKALSDINKSFGEGTIRIYGSSPVVPLTVISSGSLMLDKALGVGGYPRGRVVEIYGPESAGKCLDGETYCLTPDGMLTIKEVFKINNIEPSCSSKITPKNYSLLNENGEMEDSTCFTNNNRKPVLSIETKTGLTIKSTLNHPLRVISDNGFIEWKKTSEIKVGDYMVVMRNTNVFGKTPIDPDEARLLGYIVADGYIGDPKRLQFSNSDDEVVVDFKSLAEKYLGSKNIKTYTKGTTVDHHINSKEIKHLFDEKYGLGLVKAGGKKVPLCIRQSPRDSVIAFLQGYYELECYVDSKKSSIEVSSASKKLLEEIHLLMINLGFMPFLSPKEVKGKTYWVLNIGGDDFALFGKIIGFRTSARKTKYNESVRIDNGRSNFNSIPFMGGIIKSIYSNMLTVDSKSSDLFCESISAKSRCNLTYPTIKRMLDMIQERGIAKTGEPFVEYIKYLSNSNFIFDKVESVCLQEAIPTFDFHMPKTHSFWSNGLISHNTTLALHAIVEAQSLGGKAVFVDAEHALDTEYAHRLGVNIDDLILSQPDNGEQALEIVDRLVKTNKIDIIVIDSVAALVPKAEIEGEMGDSHMGLQARLMSQSMRKLVGIIAKSNTIVIFLNQLRSKIGIVYGNPEVTTGGNALKFSASIRIDIRSAAADHIKNGSEVMGKRVKIKIVKNKVAPPYKQCDVDIMFNEGISRPGEIIDYGVDRGFIERAGAWYSYKGDRIGQGRDNAKEYIRSRPELMAELMELARTEINKELAKKS